MVKKVVCMIAVAVGGMLSAVHAVDGIAVSVHSSKTQSYGWAFGKIERFIIQDGGPDNGTVIYGSSDARCVSISPSGTRVAFIRSDGKVCMKSITEDASVKVLASIPKDAWIDWPVEGWIYYVNKWKGDEMWRVNTSGSPDPGRVGTGLGSAMQFSIASSLDKGTAVTCCYSACSWQMSGGKISIVGKDGGCGAGISPSGKYYTNNISGHNTVVIRTFSGSKVNSFSTSKCSGAGSNWNRNRWSANSDDWVTFTQGTPYQLQDGHHQVLYKRDGSSCIQVQPYRNGVYYEGDDFWVGNPGAAIGPVAPPAFNSIRVEPSVASVRPGGTLQLKATALDQYDAALGPQPGFAWAASGGGTVTPAGLFTAASTMGGPYTVTATARVGTVTKEGTAQISVRNVILRLNCGGPKVGEWQEEQYCTTGKNYDFLLSSPDLSKVSNPAPAEVYSTVRHQDPVYTIPSSIVPNGKYRVRLHFIDKFADGRSMSVSIEGISVLTGYNIGASAGGTGIADVKEFAVPVSDGDGMTIALNRAGGNDAFVSGIEIHAGEGAVASVQPANRGDPASFAAHGWSGPAIGIPGVGTHVVRLFDSRGATVLIRLFNGPGVLRLSSVTALPRGAYVLSVSGAAGVRNHVLGVAGR